VSRRVWKAGKTRVVKTKEIKEEKEVKKGENNRSEKGGKEMGNLR